MNYRHDSSDTRALSRSIQTLAAFALLSVGTASEAKPHSPLDCRTPAAEILSVNGRALTYEAAATVRGARKVASTGTVYAPATLPDGRTAVYAVSKDGCARLTGLQRGLR